MIVKIERLKKYVFMDNLEPADRLVEVNKMLNDTLDFDGNKMTVEEYFRETFNKDFTRTNFEKISHYLSKMPEQNGTHDKKILSRNDELEMNKGVRWATRDGNRVLEQSKYTSFTDLDKETLIELGLAESDA